MLNLQDISTWSILIVDDEPDNLEVMAETLIFFGASIKTAKDGAQGLKAMEDFQPNLILLDLSMPNMDGWEMIKQLKGGEKTKAIPVIALTAHAMRGDKSRAYTAGFDGYLTKPVNVPTIQQDIQKALEEDFKPEEEPHPAKVTTQTTSVVVLKEDKQKTSEIKTEVKETPETKVEASSESEKPVVEAEKPATIITPEADQGVAEVNKVADQNGNTASAVGT